MDTDELVNRFKFHPAVTKEKQDAHGDVRLRCQEMALWINHAVPEGREKALAMTHLEEVMMWANAAIARVN